MLLLPSFPGLSFLSLLAVGARSSPFSRDTFGGWAGGGRTERRAGIRRKEEGEEVGMTKRETFLKQDKFFCNESKKMFFKSLCSFRNGVC